MVEKYSPVFKFWIGRVMLRLINVGIWSMKLRVASARCTNTSLNFSCGFASVESRTLSGGVLGVMFIITSASVTFMSSANDVGKHSSTRVSMQINVRCFTPSPHLKLFCINQHPADTSSVCNIGVSI